MLKIKMDTMFQPPFNSSEILKKRKSLHRALLERDTGFIDKRIAILGGSTTHDIKNILELFLLYNGIRPTFYESEYGQYWQDAMFPNHALEGFQPDLVYVHTSLRNIHRFPALSRPPQEVESLLEEEYNKYKTMWERLEEVYHCPVIQNNFEFPFWRLMGNRDASDLHGRVNYITRLNLKLADYAQEHREFYINDINWLSAVYGLDEWSDPFYWHMYKYALSMNAIPSLAHSVANIIKSLYGKNKKAFALDLDNTLWGGVVGDDGAENLEIGQENSMGQVYSEFQGYIKAHKELGVLLNVISKNEAENALAGLNHPDSVLNPEDFLVVRANWDPKSQNLTEIAEELSLLPESFVFVDDNPAEREIIRQQVPGVGVPELLRPEYYIRAIDRCGYFEVTTLTADDVKRGEMYMENAVRSKSKQSFTDYGDYLRSLEMRAVIKTFEPLYLARIAQLTNKSNQFNLTTKRCTQEEMEEFSKNPGYITLYGKLMDKFGDNGIVAVAMGEIKEEICYIQLWLMSCRVLKRDMEHAMMDALIKECRVRGIVTLKAYYFPTAKNGMVRSFYETQGFILDREDEAGNKYYTLDLTKNREDQNQFIQVNISYDIEK